MKKLLALLLVAIMSLSLVACGAKTQEVEITMDNWNEYFEIVEMAHWNTNDFGETENFEILSCFCVKEEYADRIILDKSNLTVEVSKYWDVAYIDYDLKNKTFSVNEYLNLDLQMTSDRTQYDTFTLENANKENADGDTSRVIHAVENVQVPDFPYELEDGTIGHYIDQVTVSRIQGTIVVKEAK